MRTVRFSPEERVDIPDATALSFLPLGEFRRTLRALIMEHGVVGVVRGFKVAPASVPDATVVVTLDPGGGAAKSAAVGAENTGIIDRGQLIGDTGQEGLEGNATYAIDFTAQAPGSWKVEMRFAYVDGANDNRAFWNPATDAEYISSVDTRTLPTIEFQIVAAYTGNEWIPLATVAWGGATVVAGNITDDRNLLFEGASPWVQTTQEGTGALPDFDRDDDRPDVTNDVVYSALRKLGRQIQDIKGPDVDGKWSFHRRPIGPMDPGSLLDEGITKSINTLDTQEYVVGDGTTAWGDFNGTAGLQACLTHIAASQADLPSRIRIRLKSRQTGLAGYLSGAPAPIWTCTTEVTISTSKHIEIIGDVSKADKYGRVPVAFTHNTGAFFNFTATSGSLKLTNIAMHSVPVQGLFQSSTCVLHLDNTMICAASAVYVVRSNTMGMRWINSEIYGAVQVFTNDASAGAGNSYGWLWHGCHFSVRTVWGTLITSHLRFWGDPTFSDDKADATFFATQGRVENCGIYFGGQTAATSTRECNVDLRGAVQVTFENVSFGHTLDSNLVQFGTVGTAPLRSVSTLITFKRIFILGSTPTNAAHDVDAGYNTTKGTGWTFFSTPDGNSPGDYDDLEHDVVQEIVLDTIRWASMPNIDSGCVRFEGQFQDCTFKNLRCQGTSFPAITYGGTPRITCMYLEQTANPFNTANGSGPIIVDTCSFGRIDFAGAEPIVRHIAVNGYFDTGLVIDNCTFAVTDVDGTRNDTDYAASRALMGVELKTGCTGLTIRESRFLNFKPTGTDEIAAVCMTSTSNTMLDLAGCLFQDSTYCVVVDAAGGTPGKHSILLRNNRFSYVGSANPFWILKADTLPAEITAAGKIHMTGNLVLNSPIGAVDMVNCGAYTNNALLFSGNNFTRFGTVTTTSTNPVGLGTSPPQNIDAGLPVSLTGAGRESMSFRNGGVVRILMLNPTLAGMPRGTGLADVVWYQYFGGLDKIQAEDGGALAKLPLSGILPVEAEITKIRMGITRNAASGTMTMRLRRQTTDFATAFGGDVVDTPWSATHAVAGDLLVDSGAIASNNEFTGNTNTFWIEVVSAAGATTGDPDTVHWIELTYLDKGYRG